MSEKPIKIMGVSLILSRESSGSVIKRPYGRVFGKGKTNKEAIAKATQYLIWASKQP